MNKIILSIMIVMLLSACNTKDSNEVVDQSKIYGDYKVTGNKNFKRVYAKVTFREQSNRWAHDYIALRGDSYISFNGTRMQEVRTWLDQTHYEQNFDLINPVQSEDVVTFLYKDNDSVIHRIELNFPALASVDHSSINVFSENENTNMRLNFYWDFDPYQNNENTTKIIVKFWDGRNESDLLSTRDRNVSISIPVTRFDSDNYFQICTKKSADRTQAIICNKKISLLNL